MKMSSAFPSQYLRASDLEGRQVNVTIDTVNMQEVGQGSEAKQLPVVYFVGKDSGLVLNKTNANVLVAAFGDESDAWSGRKITLFSTPVPYQGKMVDGIRFTIPQQDEQQQQAAPINVDDTDVPF